jgi:hypothetical protein
VASDTNYAEDLLRMTGQTVTRILIVKPISRSRAEAYLDSLSDPAALAPSGIVPDVPASYLFS